MVTYRTILHGFRTTVRGISFSVKVDFAEFLGGTPLFVVGHQKCKMPSTELRVAMLYSALCASHADWTLFCC